MTFDCVGFVFASLCRSKFVQVSLSLVDPEIVRIVTSSALSLVDPEMVCIVTSG